MSKVAILPPHSLAAEKALLGAVLSDPSVFISVSDVAVSSAGSVLYVLSFKLWCETSLLLNMADMDYLLCGKLWSEQC